MRIEGKVAIVTGAASGIGAACAETLARAGAKVIATDIDKAGGEGVVRRIEAAGGIALFLDQDVTVEERWPQVIAATQERFGRLDIMVANAGIGLMGPLEQMSLADWRRQQAINLDGVFLAVKHAIPAMRRSGGGSIILMSSVAGLRGSPGLAAYCATKGGVRLLRQGGGAGSGKRQHPCELGASRHHRHPDLDQDESGRGRGAPQCADRPARAREPGRTARRRRPGPGHRRRRPVPRLRRRPLHDRHPSS